MNLSRIRNLLIGGLILVGILGWMFAWWNESDQQIIQKIFGHCATVNYNQQKQAIRIIYPAYPTPTPFNPFRTLRNTYAQNVLGSIRRTDWVTTRIQYFENLYPQRSCNTIKNRLASEIGQLTQLKQLKITTHHDGITIPREIGNLTNLEILDLAYLGPYFGSNGPSISLPSEIGNLTKLQELSLVGYNSPSLPVEIGGLVALKKLVSTNK